MFVQLLAATGVLAVLTLVPGPDMAVVTKRALASGWRDGLRTVGGITAGLLVWGTLTVVGLAAVLAASATARRRSLSNAWAVSSSPGVSSPRRV